MNRNILLLGNTLLREKSIEIFDFNHEDFRRDIADLKDTLEDFRRKKGFGRGIAAPQIGIPKRIVALNLGKRAFVLVNPEITWKSGETFMLWDDCMSFPDLYVRVQRSRSISITYQDETGIHREWEHLGREESELLQHETDHLQGILAIDRVLDGKDIIYKTEFDTNRDFYLQKVDYTIEPTISSCYLPK
jgi:peptide deformylase